jgi:rubrerythrin
MAMTMFAVVVLFLIALSVAARATSRFSRRPVPVTIRACSICGSSFTVNGTAPAPCPRCDRAA